MKKPQFKSINYVGIINSIIVVFLFSPFVLFGQVGIGTTSPNAALDIRSSSQLNPANNDGVLIPKVDNFPFINPTANQDGMLVFVTGNGVPNRGFYYWDNTNATWVPLTMTGGGSGNTLDQAYDQGGNGLGKNINATNGSVRVNGTDGFLVTGEVFYGNPIDTEITGPGTRMFFNPLLSAFRAGHIWDIPPFSAGNEWDASNIGLFSIAFGQNTMASGLGSSAFGNFTIASGNESTAFGSGSIASGSSSTAFGFSTAASEGYATAFGYQTSASATTSTAFGSFSSASESYSTAFGFQSSASGVSSTAFGSSVLASGDTSTAFGASTLASGNTATAFGSQTLASGSNSVAFGSNSVASGTASTAFGFGTIAPSSYETALGMYNTNYVPVATSGYSLQDRIFVVGNGVGNAGRSNAFTIYKSGIIIIDNVLGISTNSPTATLSVNGIANKPGGGTWAVFSDARLKKDVNNYAEGLELIMKVRPVNFSYNYKIKTLFGENQVVDNRIYQGIIAQELKEIAPDMVREITVNNETYLEVDPNKFTYALINAVKQQQKIIKEQHNKISNLENLLMTQSEDIDTIKELLKDL